MVCLSLMVCLSPMGVCHFSPTTLQPHSSVLAFRTHFFRNVKKIFLPFKTVENIEEVWLFSLQK